MKFRTLRLQLDKPLDREWLAEIGRRSRFLWVRVTGLCDNSSTHIPSFQCRQWEDFATGCVPKHRPPAYALVSPYSPTFGRRRRWAAIEGMPQKLDELLTMLRSQYHRPIGMLADDFAARWLLGMRYNADVIVLDTPVISQDEYDTKINDSWRHDDLVSRVVIRQASEHWMSEWKWWEMHFPMAALVEPNMTFGFHGRWEKVGRRNDYTQFARRVAQKLEGIT